MIDPYLLLQNRTDLEKLEQDLAALADLTGSELQDEVGAGPGSAEELRQQIRAARQELEKIRAAHIDLCFRLTQHDGPTRAAARNELVQRIQAGELKIYDPRANIWRQASDLLIDANLQEEDSERQEKERRQVEDSLAVAAGKTGRLIDLQRLLRKADELDRKQLLSIQGRELLAKVQAIYDEGLNHHRDLTLKIHDGTLKEKHYALGEIRSLVTNGEAQILDAPTHTWRPAMDVMADAEEEYSKTSENLVGKILKRVEEQYKINPDRAINAFYQALDQTIPYREEDRSTLELRYLELHRLFERRAGPVPMEEEAYQALKKKTALDYKSLLNRSAVWLYQFYDSALTRPVSKLIMEAGKPGIPSATTLQLLEMAVSVARQTLEGSIEIPEVMVRGGILLFNLGLSDQARALLDQAIPLYSMERPLKIHRHAVTAWLLGLVDYSMGKRLHGYSDWKTARALFMDLQKEADRLKNVEMADWYKARLVEMDTQAVQTFEMVYYQWLNAFEPIFLTEGLRETRRIIDSQFGRQQYAELKKSLQQMLKDSQQELEVDPYRVTLVEAAFFEYQLNDFQAAADHLNEAWIRFQHNHHGAVVLWLLGMVRWWIPAQRTQALLNWEESIRLFHDLALQADQSNEQNQRIWYETQARLMSTCLKQWIGLTH